MKRFLIMALCMLTLGAAENLSAQRSQRPRTVRGSGRTATETYRVGRFDGIRSSQGIDVIVAQGPFSIRATSDQNALKHLRIDVDDDVLRIRYKDRINLRDINTTVYVTMPELESLQVSSGSDIVLSYRFSGRELEADASSAGSITGSVDYNYIEVDVSSGGEINLEGRADRVEVEASSGSNANLLDVHAQRVEVEASSGGSASVYATSYINGKVSSGAVIRYAGNPDNIDIRKSSGGSVRSIQQRR